MLSMYKRPLKIIQIERLSSPVDIGFLKNQSNFEMINTDSKRKGSCTSNMNFDLLTPGRSPHEFGISPLTRGSFFSGKNNLEKILN